MSGHVAVLGAGNIAQTLAAHLAIQGHEVRLYNRWEKEIAPLREKGTIALSGLVEGTGRLAAISTNVAEVVPGASVVFIATPAFAHRDLAEACAPYLEEGQVVLLHPGAFGACLEFARITHDRALVAESASSLYIARITGPGTVKVLTLKTSIQIAAFPATSTEAAIARLAPIFPATLRPASSILETGINNSQAIIHCPAVLFNYSRVEGGEEWLFWKGITQGAANLIDALDEERMALARALGMAIETKGEFYERAYGLKNVTTLEAMHNIFSRGGGAKGPADRNHRYIFEDIPYALVPWVSLGRQLGVPMPMTESLINIFIAASGQDLWAMGRTVASMGLEGLNVAQMRALVHDGGVATAR